MKRTALATIAFLAFVAVASFRQAVTNVASPKIDIFFGTSPCADFVKPKLQIPAGENCDRIQWQLTVFETGKYSLQREWGYHVDNQTYLKKGTSSLGGVWTLAKGRTGDPNGIVVQLDADKSASIAFASIHPDILHLLDPKKDLALGDSGASYTLSRLAMSSLLPTGSQGPSTDSDVTAQVNFSGRSPCREIAKEMKRAVGADCYKVKWSIDLHRDPQTLAPTTYRLRGTLYRNDATGTERIREGKWKVTKGTKTDPNAIVYELDAFGSDGPIYLLKADHQILFFLANDRSLLVGNDKFSYTLNRGEQKRLSAN